MTNIEAYNFLQAAIAEYVQILNHTSPASAQAIASMSNNALAVISLDVIASNQLKEAREKGLDLNKLPSYNTGPSPDEIVNPTNGQVEHTDHQFVGATGTLLED